MTKLLLLAVALTAACSAKPEPTPSAPPPHGGGRPLLTAEVVGYWSGNWGNLVFREQGGKLVAAYDHDAGTIVGTIAGDKLVGWWCETPTREPTKDAGEVEMTFITKDGLRSIDGRWRYGTDGVWKEDWDINFGAGEPPAALVARFEDPSAFCPKP